MICFFFFFLSYLNFHVWIELSCDWLLLWNDWHFSHLDKYFHRFSTGFHHRKRRLILNFERKQFGLVKQHKSFFTHNEKIIRSRRQKHGATRSSSHSCKFLIGIISLFCDTAWSNFSLIVVIYTVKVYPYLSTFPFLPDLGVCRR